MNPLGNREGKKDAMTREPGYLPLLASSPHCSGLACGAEVRFQ